MNRNLKVKVAVAGLLLGVAGSAVAGPPSRGSTIDYARVVDVVPIVQRVRVGVPARECWRETEFQTVRRETRGYSPVPSVAPTIAGGIIGGVIGHQFGSGSGKDAMTALGAVVGATIGTQAAHNAAHASATTRVVYEERPVTVERCQTVTDFRVEERIQGYRVTYVYAGREFQTTMASHPGTSIPVRVSVVPTPGRR